MKLLIISVLTAGLLGCSSSKDATFEAEDPIVGTWYYDAFGSKISSPRGISVTIEKTGAISISHYYGYKNYQAIVVYERKAVGTYTRNGTVFDITYTHETCDPVVQEILHMTMGNDLLIIQNTAKTVGYSFSKTIPPAFKTLTVVEDTNCSILSKIEIVQKRAVANTKSILDRIETK